MVLDLKQSLRDLSVLLDDCFDSLRLSVFDEVRDSAFRREKLLAVLDDWQVQMKKLLALVLKSCGQSSIGIDHVCDNNLSSIGINFPSIGIV